MSAWGQVVSVGGVGGGGLKGEGGWRGEGERVRVVICNKTKS